MVGLSVCLSTFGQVTARPGEQVLKFFNIHTKERAEIVFRRNGVYDRRGLSEINRFLRDWRQDEPTRMDPALLDLVWEVYRRSGSRDYIHVVSAYRSPTTNGMLRRRSKGVAKSSLHMKGQAIDFYLPDVKLSKLRALGLKIQYGGVGYYPRSGAPFVHMDTGSVRHWPRMSRKQLMALFPDGRTMHVPSDGRPLAGYAVAKAEVQARKSGRTAIAAIAPEPAPIRTASVPADPLVVAPVPAQPPPRPVGVAVASYDAVAAPLPRLAPRRSRAITAPLATPLPAVAPSQPEIPADIVVARADTAPSVLAPRFDFSTPEVPANLAAAMAERDQSRRGGSLPIAPTSVVQTIDVNRPLRADTITTAVLADQTRPPAVPVLSYAAVQDPADRGVRLAAIAGIPLPKVNPLRRIAAAPTTRSVVPERRFKAPQLTMTALDTVGLRSWTGPGSTRQRSFAVLTMPDLRALPDVIDVPRYGYAGGFGPTAYPDLRTDRFAGPLTRRPVIARLAGQ